MMICTQKSGHIMRYLTFLFAINSSYLVLTCFLSAFSYMKPSAMQQI